MAKYFSSKKTKTNNYTYTELALLLSELDNADQIFGTEAYKKMLRKTVILLDDKTKPCYLDLSEFRNKATGHWIKKVSGPKLVDMINEDIDLFTEERLAQKSFEQ